MHLKTYLRACVIRTSRPPIDGLYRNLYRLVIHLVAKVLGRCRGVVAVYLIRGCAKGDIMPGVSDIDLVVAVQDDDQAAKTARAACRALHTMTGHLVEYNPKMVGSQEALRHRWRTNPWWRYYYREGLTTWKLLVGTDIRAGIEPQTEIHRRTSCYLELCRWWLVFANGIFNTRDQSADRIFRNVTCFKAITESSNVLRALRTGEYRTSRILALEGDRSPLAERLRTLHKRRFLAVDDDLPEKTFQFLVSLFSDLWNGFREDPFLAVCPGMKQTLDDSKDMLSPDDVQLRDSLQQHLDEEWSSVCLGLHFVRSAFFALDDRLIIVDVDADRLPDVHKLTRLIATCRRLSPDSPERLFVFLRINGIAFLLTPVMPRDLHRGLLTPATVPDVSLQLGDRDIYWTDYTAWYLCDHRTNEYWSNASAEKQSQLDCIAAGAARGLVEYPLTRAALDRQLHKAQTHVLEGMQ
jgi:hypothetical protein